MEISSLVAVGRRGGIREGGAAAEDEEGPRVEVGVGGGETDGLRGSVLTSSKTPLAPPVVAAAGALPPAAALATSARPLSADSALGAIDAP